MRTKPSLRQIAAVLALAAALALGSPLQAAPAKAGPTAPAALAGDLLAPLRALLAQAAGALRSLWSAEGETGQSTLEGEMGNAGGTSQIPGVSDLLENGAGIDPNG